MSEIFAIIFGTLAAIWIAGGLIILTSNRLDTKANVTEREQND